MKKDNQSGEILLVVVLLFGLVSTMTYFLSRQVIQNKKISTKIEASSKNETNNESILEEIIANNENSSLEIPTSTQNDNSSTILKPETSGDLGIARKNVSKDSFVTYYLSNYDPRTNLFTSLGVVPTALCMSGDTSTEVRFFYKKNDKIQTLSKVYSSKKEVFFDSIPLSSSDVDCEDYQYMISFDLPQNEYILATIRNLEKSPVDMKMIFPKSGKTPPQGQIIEVSTKSASGLTTTKRVFKFYPQLLQQLLMFRW